MKKIYLLILPCIIAAACSKDFLKSYDKRITGGTWELYDVNNIGLGGRYNSPLGSGFFTFLSSGDLEYRDLQGNTYQGNWDIRKNWQGDSDSRSLFVTVTNFQTRQVLSEYFDDMSFTGTNRFRAYINNGGRTYTYKFKR